VIDGDRRFGNGHCLPAGPMREGASRLGSVDMIVANAKAARAEFLMEYEPLALRALLDEARRADIDGFRGRDVHAVAGIGNPGRFFSYLRSRELHIIKHEFPDHHRFQPSDLQFGDELPVVMTEKDAVKCRPFAGDDFWYVPIEARMSPAFQHRFTGLLAGVAGGQEAA
jgi:tetraacyldisaccharide 4'-kinase